MASLPILYSFRRCPYAMRARLALASAGITVELREVVLKNKPAAMLALSPKATVPVLQLPDGAVLDESIDIMRWALEQNDPHGWLNANTESTAQLIADNDGEFKHWLDHYKYFERHPENSQEHYREKAELFLQQWENRLAENSGAGLMVEQLTIADMALLPFVRQFAHSDLNWFNSSPYPQLREWLSRFKQSPLFANVMTKRAAWEPKQPITVEQWTAAA